MLPLFYLGGAEIEPIPCKCPVGTCRSAAGCRTLLTICPQGQIGHRFPDPAPKQNSIPSGCCFCFGKKGRESNPSNASARWALAVRQLDAERSLRSAPKGKSAIDSRTLKGPQHGAVDDIHFEPVHLFSSRASCFGRSKKQGAALWFLSIAQLRCGAYTNRIQIERKVRSSL